MGTSVIFKINSNIYQEDFPQNRNIIRLFTDHSLIINILYCDGLSRKIGMTRGPPQFIISNEKYFILFMYITRDLGSIEK